MNNEEKILGMLEQINRRLDSMDGRFDGIDGRLDGMDGRLGRVESAQEEMRGDISRMQETLTRVAVTQEGVVLPRLQLALEGHSELNRKMDALAPKERVEVLEDRVITLETAVKAMTKRLAALEKA